MRQTAAMPIILSNQIVYIDELLLEQKSNQDRKWSVLFIPPVVMFFMLEFLSSKHVDRMRAQSALDNLQAIVHHDKNRVIDVIKREILGICQQIAGNLQAALYSYQQSLRQYPYNKLQTATRHRIQDLISNEQPYRKAANKFYSQHGKHTVRNGPYSNVY